MTTPEEPRLSEFSSLVSEFAGDRLPLALESLTVYYAVVGDANVGEPGYGKEQPFDAADFTIAIEQNPLHASVQFQLLRSVVLHRAEVFLTEVFEDSKGFGHRRTLGGPIERAESGSEEDPVIGRVFAVVGAIKQYKRQFQRIDSAD